MNRTELILNIGKHYNNQPIWKKFLLLFKKKLCYSNQLDKRLIIYKELFGKKYIYNIR